MAFLCGNGRSSYHTCHIYHILRLNMTHMIGMIRVGHKTWRRGEGARNKFIRTQSLSGSQTLRHPANELDMLIHIRH